MACFFLPIVVATPAPPPPATTATTSEYEEDDNEGEEKEERTRTANDGGGLGRGKFIGSADDGRIGPETEGESTRTVGEGKRSRDLPQCHCDISTLSVRVYDPSFHPIYSVFNMDEMNLLLHPLLSQYFCHDGLTFLPLKEKEEQEKGCEQELRLCIHVNEFDERVEDNLHCSFVVRSSKLRYLLM